MASQAELDALKKRVRDLERAAATASGRAKSEVDVDEEAPARKATSAKTVRNDGHRAAAGIRRLTRMRRR